MSIKISILIYISLLILSVFVGCVSSSGDIDIIGSWQIDDNVFTITNEEITISDYAKGTVVKYDNDKDYAVIFFDEHVSPGVHQKYVKVAWINLTETSVTLNVYEPHDSPELAEATSSIFETNELDKI